MAWLRSYYLILVALLNKGLTGESPQLRTDLRLITLTITASNVCVKLLKALQKKKRLLN